MKTLLCFVLMAALAGIALADVDVSGKWSGTFNATYPNGETNEFKPRVSETPSTPAIQVL
jgi:hypothetical protein